MVSRVMMRMPCTLLAVLALAGCQAVGSVYIPGLEPPNLPLGYQGSQAYQQPPVYPQAAYQPPYVARTADDLAPHDYEHTKDIEIREKSPSDDAWCSQPWVVTTLKEIGSMRTEISQRRAHEMAGQMETGLFKPDLITAIIGMSGGEHHCIGLSREECIGDGSKHVCRGLLTQDRHDPVWMLFVIQGEHFDDARWRRDDVQY